jgi:C4-dicarboxylate transporter DctQ subunit
MEGMFQKIASTLDRVIGVFETAFLTAGLAVMVAALFAEVVCGFFKVSLPWAGELAMYLMVWVMCFGASAAVRSRSHISVGLIADRLRGAPALAVRLAVLAFCFLLCLGGVVLGYEYARLAFVSGKVSVVLKAPMWVVYAALPVTAGLMAVRVVLLAARGFATRGRLNENGKDSAL